MYRKSDKVFVRLKLKSVFDKKGTLIRTKKYNKT